MQKTKLNYTFLGHYHLLGAIYYHVRFGNQDNFLPVFSIPVFAALLPLHKYGVTIMCDSGQDLRACPSSTSWCTLMDACSSISQLMHLGISKVRVNVPAIYIFLSFQISTVKLYVTMQQILFSVHIKLFNFLMFLQSLSSPCSSNVFVFRSCIYC